MRRHRGSRLAARPPEGDQPAIAATVLKFLTSVSSSPNVGHCIFQAARLRADGHASCGAGVAMPLHCAPDGAPRAWPAELLLGALGAEAADRVARRQHRLLELGWRLAGDMMRRPAAVFEVRFAVLEEAPQQLADGVRGVRKLQAVARMPCCRAVSTMGCGR